MTPGCYICDPAAFDRDEEPCDECEQRWNDYIHGLLIGLGVGGTR